MGVPFLRAGMEGLIGLIGLVGREDENLGLGARVLLFSFGVVNGGEGEGEGPLYMFIYLPTFFLFLVSIS